MEYYRFYHSTELRIEPKLLDRVTTKDTKTSVYDLFRDLDVKVHTEKEKGKSPVKEKPKNYLMDLINAMHDKPNGKENVADRGVVAALIN
jgi:hypothetical protein